MSTPEPPPRSLFDTESTRVAGETGSSPSKFDTLPTAERAVGQGANAPRQVGRYRVISRIGRGGMASVYKAHDPSIDRALAIKFLHTEYCEQEEYRGRFLREARAAGNLSHPNIVTVHDVGEIDHRPYMAMELIEGEPLNDLMSRVGPMPIADVISLGIQLGKALDYAHSKGVVHRDIKPSNIMCVAGAQHVKVTDFGIAHVTSSSSQAQTRVGDVLGTPQYMSPEQTKGNKVDGRSDLFSVGIILYQMLAGQAPFKSDSIVALAMMIANDEPTPIQKLRPDIPQEMRRIVERCLAKSPDRRFQTGRELADAMIRLQRDLEDEAREKGRSKIMPLRVKWALMMGAIVFVVMAITGTVVNKQQTAAMMSQVTDYGASLSRFIAAQNAVSALADEWVAVDVSVQEIMKTRDFTDITIIDRSGLVRASSQAAWVGQPYKPRSGEVLGKRAGDVTVTRYVDGADTVLGFEAPMTFQGKAVGRVALGIPEKPLAYVARLSLTLMVVLVLVTVIAVALAMYFLANWFARPIKTLTQSMSEIAQGRLDHRIAEERKDEFGLLFKSFDGMAQALQHRYMPAARPPTPQETPGPRPPAVAPKAAAPAPGPAGDTHKMPR
ncbi:MAG TPA: protein kinase [Rhizobacter sp.]|nr:protein kinase [Rhizobacter sp.]